MSSASIFQSLFLYKQTFHNFISTEILQIDNHLGNHDTQFGGGGGGAQLYNIIAYCIMHHVYNLYESTYFTQSEIQIILKFY